MSEIVRVKDHKELYTRWRHLNGFDFGEDDLLLSVAIGAVQRGLVLVVVTGGKSSAICIATVDEGGVVRLHTLPQCSGESQGKQCLDWVKAWAKEEGHKEIRVATENLSGASFRYFEKTLNMRRRYVVFSVTV